MREFGLQVHHFDGCQFGLQSSSGKHRGSLLKKPWTIATDVPDFKVFDQYKCTHPMGSHAPVAGQDTKATESYTDSLVQLIHSCWRGWCAGGSPVASRLPPGDDLAVRSSSTADPVS